VERTSLYTRPASSLRDSGVLLRLSRLLALPAHLLRVHLAVTSVVEEDSVVEVEAVVVAEATVAVEAMEVVEADEVVEVMTRDTVVAEEDTVVEEDLVEVVVVAATNLSTALNNFQQSLYMGHCARVQCLS